MVGLGDKKHRRPVPIDGEDDPFLKDKRDRGLWKYEQIRSETGFQRIGAIVLGCIMFVLGAAPLYLGWQKRSDYGGMLGLLLVMVWPLAFLAWGVLLVHSPIIYYFRRIRQRKQNGQPK